ncbi:MAG TPA: TIGR02996 domain-containing protein, partial [Pirellulales bacterium]
MTRPPVRDEASTITVKTLGRIGAAINQADAPPPGGARFARSTRREFGMNPSHSDDPQSSGSASRASPVEDARLVGLGSLDGLAREAVLAALDRGERHEALLAAATAQPHDDAPRLIYADWLEEQGDDAQAEFIRAHCALASPHLPEGDRAALAARVEELFAERGHEWVRPLVAFGCDPAQVRLADFDRGLLASVQATVPFIAPERLFRVVPTIRRLALRGSHVRGPLFDLPHTEQLTDLTIELISADDFAALIAGKRWKSLEALALRKAWLKPEVVYSLARGAWPKLRRLSLSGSHMQNSGATALASTFLLTQLETLELASTELKSAGVLDLSRSSLAAGLKTLVLDDNGLDDDALLALADSPYLTRLRR